MSKVIKIKKGLDIPLEGKSNGKIADRRDVSHYGIVPSDYPGYTWKCVVRPGDNVRAGEALLHAKEDSRLNVVSPVDAKVTDVNRGERRRIEYIELEKSSDNIGKQPINAAESKLEQLIASGLFAMIRQRPYDIIPNTNVTPRDIFITSFDTSPLAFEILSEDNKKYLESGIKVLSSLTSGKVYLSVRKGSDLTSSIAEVVEFEGPHPAGNVGVQIANINPVNKGEVVWTMDAVTASRIGRYFETGDLDFTTTVAFTGPEMKSPHNALTYFGASLKELLKGELKSDDKGVRIISGNVLTGKQESLQSGFLRYPYRQITAIEEGDDADEFMGWASMSPKKYSVSRTFPAFLRGLSKPFRFDARIKGGHRAMIMSGEYDKVFPMDIYPEFLIKAIIGKDIDKMEQLGIYEVAPEDFALAEFVDTSKLELQKIVREGLDYLRKETM